MSAESPRLYGVMAEFETPEEATRAANAAREKGFAHLDAFGPFESEELTEAIGFHEHTMAKCVLGGGIAGGLGGFALQYWATVLDYPHNIGGRPVFSWPAFIPIIFECTVLVATLTGIVSLLILNRLPRLSHPAFAAKNFDRATTDHFFLCLRADAADFDAEAARSVLSAFAPLSISVLNREDVP
jgi:hypothetical protein